MTPMMIRNEFLGLTNDNLKAWEFILNDEIANGPRQTVSLTRLELDILRAVMEERGIR